MKAFQAGSPDIEVDGRTLLADIEGILLGAVARELFARHGMTSIEPAGWYPLQAWLSVYRFIQEQLGPETLFSIGRRVPYNAEFPVEQIFDVASALRSLNDAYQSAHRNGDVGQYRFVEIGMDHYEVHCDNPYPNEFDFGIVCSLVERFHGRLQFNVNMKQPAVEPERDNACVIEIVRI